MTSESAQLLRSWPLIDAHNDLPAALRSSAGYSVERLDCARPELHTDIPRLRAGAVSAQFWSVWVPSHLPPAEAVVATLEQIDAVHRLVARYPNDFELALSADDIDLAHGRSRIASLIGIEGGHSIASSLGVLRMLFRLGARYMTLTHTDDTEWAASATGLRQTTGLSETGVDIIREMNRIGMVVDLSHTSESTQVDALAVSSAPVMFSHSSARALVDHPRNVSDVMLEQVARSGGVVHVTFVPEFVSADAAAWTAAFELEKSALGGVPRHYPAAPKPGETAEAARQRNLIDRSLVEHAARDAERQLAKWVASHPCPVSTMADVADHLDHVRAVAGIDHVGIGGDFDGTTEVSDGLGDVSGYPELFALLSQRRWSDDELGKLAGGNILRVLRDVESVARLA